MCLKNWQIEGPDPTISKERQCWTILPIVHVLLRPMTKHWKYFLCTISVYSMVIYMVRPGYNPLDSEHFHHLNKGVEFTVMTASPVRTSATVPTELKVSAWGATRSCTCGMSAVQRGGRELAGGITNLRYLIFKYRKRSTLPLQS